MPSTGPEHTLGQENMIHVAAGVVENARGEILIAKRPDHLHQGGLWEFPGGKIEPGEDVFIALRRELKEEVNLAIQQTQPLIQIPWHYPDKSVLLDVLRIVDYDGEARGLEGQTIQWVRKTDLANYTFPAANQGIVNALMLPDSYMITGAFNEVAEFKTRLESQLQQGIRLVQLRARHIDESELDVYIKIAKELCETYHARLLLNANIKKAREFGIGVHLTSQQLMESKVRPFDKHALVAASVHNEQELQQANQLAAKLIQRG